jgi:hypothetical protein
MIMEAGTKKNAGATAARAAGTYGEFIDDT